MAEDLLEGPSHDRPLDRAFGPVTLQDNPPTSHAAPKRRWTQQKNQWLYPLPANAARSKWRVQFHVGKRLRRSPHRTVLRQARSPHSGPPGVPPWSSSSTTPIVYSSKGTEKHTSWGAIGRHYLVSSNPMGDNTDAWWRWEIKPHSKHNRQSTFSTHRHRGAWPCLGRDARWMSSTSKCSKDHRNRTARNEHHLTKCGLKDLHLAQNKAVHLPALKKLMKNELLEEAMFPEDVQDFAKRYYNQEKDLLFLNPDDILCVTYDTQYCALHVRPCMIVMAQLYQHGILYRAHEESGHRCVGKVLAWIQQRHTWPGIKKDVVNHIKQCLTCQQAKHHGGNPCYPLQSINSSNFNDLVQFDHLKLCKTESGNTELLVIIDHCIKFAEAVPFAHDEYDAQTTAKINLNKCFARHGTPARMQCDELHSRKSPGTPESVSSNQSYIHHSAPQMQWTRWSTK